MAEARVVRFCTHAGYVKSQHMDDKSPLKGAWSGSHDPFFNFAANHIVGIAEARHVSCRVLIDTEECYCMHDTCTCILPSNGMCSKSRDLF